MLCAALRRMAAVGERCLPWLVAGHLIFLLSCNAPFTAANFKPPPSLDSAQLSLPTWPLWYSTRLSSGLFATPARMYLACLPCRRLTRASLGKPHFWLGCAAMIGTSDLRRRSIFFTNSECSQELSKQACWSEVQFVVIKKGGGGSPPPQHPPEALPSNGWRISSRPSWVPLWRCPSKEDMRRRVTTLTPNEKTSSVQLRVPKYHQTMQQPCSAVQLSSLPRMVLMIGRQSWKRTSWWRLAIKGALK